MIKFSSFLLIVLFIGNAFGQENFQLTLRVKGGITQEQLKDIDIALDVYAANVIVHRDRFNSYPSTITQTISNPNNEKISFEVEVYGPKGYRTEHNPIIYFSGSPYLFLRKVDDIYFSRKEKSEKLRESNNWDAAIKNYDYLLKEDMFTSPDQRFEINREKAKTYFEAGDQAEGLKSYVELYEDRFNTIDSLPTAKKKLFLKEYFDSVLKTGNYNQLEYPKYDFPDVIKKEEAFPMQRWDNIVSLYKDIYGADELTSKDLETQFMVIGKKLGIFID